MTTPATPAVPAEPAEHCMCEACRDGVIHDSDCAQHNKGVPELYGPCDCSVWLAEAMRLKRALLKALEADATAGDDGEAFAIADDAFDAHLRSRFALAASPTASPSVLRQAMEALELAHNGMNWYRDRYPETVTGSDDEADEQIDAALSAIRSELAAPSLPLTAGRDYKGLAQALRHQKQIDEDGVMCGISRQAADEAAEIVEALASLPPVEITEAALPTPEMIWAGNSLMACGTANAADVWRVMEAAKLGCQHTFTWQLGEGRKRCETCGCTQEGSAPTFVEVPDCINALAHIDLVDRILEDGGYTADSSARHHLALARSFVAVGEPAPEDARAISTLAEAREVAVAAEADGLLGIYPSACVVLAREVKRWEEAHAEWLQSQRSQPQLDGCDCGALCKDDGQNCRYAMRTISAATSQSRFHPAALRVLADSLEQHRYPDLCPNENFDRAAEALRDFANFITRGALI